MKAASKNIVDRVMAAVLLSLIVAGTVTAGVEDYFKIQVVDRQSGRGVPLVELRTTNNIRYFTDSNGICAFYEPGLMDREVFFFVESHGYEYPKDGFGMRGTRLKATPGGSAIIKINRINIAQRLYRVTGGGIYRDSVLTGHPVPIDKPLLNAQVVGQDSVYTCVYRGRLFWMWGDTSRAWYPLGHFGAAGAFSSLSDEGGLDPDLGVNLDYYVDKTGFSRPLCRMKEKGMYWLDGLLTVKDPAGKVRMVAKCARMKSLGEAYERGLVVFDDESESFEWLVRSGPDYLPYHNSGHAFQVDVDGEVYHYFATQFPLTARMRVRDDWDCIVDVKHHEVFTGVNARQPRWITVENLLKNTDLAMSDLIKTLRKEKEQSTRLYDIETGDEVVPHGGSIYFNPFRKRWVMITVQHFGKSSLLGEVWYAEADTPVGPWVYARKIATHNKYSFYNPMQHPYFDKDGGRVIYFEGTYSHTFSGSLETATPRYDYNQIMYRLDLDDKRLVLPAAVYRVAGRYKMRMDVEKANEWDKVEDVVFFAVEPDRPHEKLTAVYQNHGRLTTIAPNRSAKPLFYVTGPDELPDKNPSIVPLWEYRSLNTGQYLYATTKAPATKDCQRSDKPLCRVWKSPAETLMDTETRPCPWQMRLSP